MKLICIYGPPGAGKYTVGKELERTTELKLFHNHCMDEPVTLLFPFGSPSFRRVNVAARHALIEFAAKERFPGLIYTFCYAKKEDDVRFKKLLRNVEKNGGTVCLVHLYCEPSTLHKRIKSVSRKKHHKIKSSVLLDEVLGKYDLYSTLPGWNSLRIDNTTKSVKTVAQQIKRHYKL